MMKIKKTDKFDFFIFSRYYFYRDLDGNLINAAMPQSGED